jgi:aminoglycoside phosphotransferase (APT) family kinase protein
MIINETTPPPVPQARTFSLEVTEEELRLLFAGMYTLSGDDVRRVLGHEDAPMLRVGLSHQLKKVASVE